MKIIKGLPHQNKMTCLLGDLFLPIYSTFLALFSITYLDLLPHEEHRQSKTSASAPDSRLSSPAPSRCDRFSAFLSRCLSAMCSWVFPSFSSSVDSMSEPSWSCSWQASRGCGQSNPTFCCGSVRLLVLDLLSSTVPRF